MKRLRKSINVHVVKVTIPKRLQADLVREVLRWYSHVSPVTLQAVLITLIEEGLARRLPK
jgi:hypothetical protein